MANTYTRKIGNNRGKLRLWLEGAILKDNGFNKGDKYSLVDLNNAYLVVLDPDGKRKIAGTEDRPIIDINSSEKLGRFGDVGFLVNIECVTKGQLMITKGETK